MPDTRSPRPVKFWPLDENDAPDGDLEKLRDFLNADRSRVSWFPAGAFEALRQREVA